MSKLKEKYLFKEMQGKMITDILINIFNNVPLSRSNINNIEKSIPVKVVFKIFTDEEDKRVFVISNDIICEIVNVENIQTKNVNVMLTNIKSTSRCAYFLAKGNIISF